MRPPWPPLAAFQLAGDRPPWQGYAWAGVSVLVCTAIDTVLFGHIDEANLILVYLLGILPVALCGHRGPAIAAALGSVAAFDFFFVVPYHTFAVSDTQYLFTFLVMGTVGGVISALTARLATEIAATRQREKRANALFELSRSLLAVREPSEVLAEGARVIGQELGLSVEAWLLGPDGEPRPVTVLGAPLGASERELLRWVLREGQPSGPGTGTLPGSAHLFLPVRTARRIHGVLGTCVVGNEPGSGDGVQAALETGANQIAIALDHASAREETVQAQAQAEAERLRSALLSSVSHDLRTPLAGIVGAASSLVDGAEALHPDVRRELALGIVEEAERLNRLVTNLLHATRLDAGPPSLHCSWTSLEEVLAPVLTRLATVLNGHPVEVDLPADLPLLQADPVLLEQVFLNLLDNAAKYTPSGTAITVRARAGRDAVTIEVADRGPGLPPGEEVHVFDKFCRFRMGEGVPGVGLGLAICRGVVVAHGGEIGAMNQATGGTLFRFSLPLPRAAAGPVRRQTMMAP